MAFKVVKMVETVVRGGEKKKKRHPHMPRAWRCAGVKQARNKSLTDVIVRRRRLSSVRKSTLLEGLPHLVFSVITTRRSCYLVGITRSFRLDDGRGRCASYTFF